MFFFAYLTRFFAIFFSVNKSYLMYPYPTRETDKKMNNNTCCQYIDLIGRYVTLSLRHWELTSDVIYNINFQYGRHQRIGTDSLTASPTLKSNGVQEKESIMVVWYGQNKSFSYQATPPLRSFLVCILNFDKTSKIFWKCNHLFGRYLGETHFVHKSRAITQLKIKEKQNVIG